MRANYTKEHLKGTAQYNIGVCLLRLLLSFGVVLDDFGHIYGGYQSLVLCCCHLF